MRAEQWMAIVWAAVGNAAFVFAFLMRRDAGQALKLANERHRETMDEGAQMIAQAMAVQDRLNRGRSAPDHDADRCGRCHAPVEEVTAFVTVCDDCAGRLVGRA